jgi:hypothetical protein
MITPPNGLDIPHYVAIRLSMLWTGPVPVNKEYDMFINTDEWDNTLISKLSYRVYTACDEIDDDVVVVVEQKKALDDTL